MRAIFLAIGVSLFAFFTAAAQTSVATSAQALTILQRALAALSPSITTHDLTLTGSAHRIDGSDDETGTVTLKATVLGDSRIDLSLPSGEISEIYNLSATLPGGQWSINNGAPHPIANHNLLSEPAWFSPATAISRRLAGIGFVATYVGAETLGSQNVSHVSITQPSKISSPAPESALFDHLTQIEVYIDSSTFLPAAMSFNIHPDDNALLDIPVLVRFSDYRSSNGANVPFHIEKYINNGLVLDLQLNTVGVNTGLPSSAFGLS